MAVNYTDVQKTEKYISRTNFDALEMAAVPEGTEFNIVDQIHESDLDSDVLQKLNNNAKINTANTFTAAQTFKKDITIEGNIIQNGSAYETHAEKLYTKNDMIYTRDGATAALVDNAYTGIQAVKYDGTNDGQLVFGKDGVARVGDIGNTQPLATRAEAGALTDGHILQWNAAGQTLVDSGKSVSDLEGGGGDVTAAGNNTFTGTNTFKTETSVSLLRTLINQNGVSVGGGPKSIGIVADTTYGYNDIKRLNTNITCTYTFPNKTGTLALISDLNTLEAKLNENIIKDPSKTYLVWKGASFPNSRLADFKAPAGCTIDWGDGNVETFDTASTAVNKHTYSDGIDYHLISLSNYTAFSNNAFNGCTGLTNVIIGNNVTSIVNGAFVSCSNLTSVTIPDSVTSMEYAFSGCSGLTSITIPDSVTSIGDSAVSNCSGLTSVTIGNGVTYIDNFAFSDCNKLKIIRMSATNPPTLKSRVFETSIEKIIVPKSAINAYKSATGWSTYADKIVYEVDSSDISDTSNFVTLSGAQTISGHKTFNNHISLHNGPDGYIELGGNWKFFGYSLNNGTGTSLSFPSGKNGTIALTRDLPEANPTAAGTVTLTKLKIGDTVYNLPSGGGSGVTSVTTSGSGNAVTSASISGNTLTLTKGSTFLTSHQSLADCAKLSGNNTFTGTNTFEAKELNPITISYDNDNCITLTGRHLEVLDTLSGEQNKKKYDTTYHSHFIMYNVIDYSGEQSKVNRMKLRFPEKEGTNSFTLATTDDIPISSATLSDNGTTLTLVLK